MTASAMSLGIAARPEVMNKHKDTKAQRHKEDRDKRLFIAVFFVSLCLCVFVFITPLTTITAPCYRQYFPAQFRTCGVSSGADSRSSRNAGYDGLPCVAPWRRL